MEKFWNKTLLGVDRVFYRSAIPGDEQFLSSHPKLLASLFFRMFSFGHP